MIKKRKSNTKGVWILEQDGKAVGQATEWFISPTQRRWSAQVTIDGHARVVANTWSVKQAIKEIEAMILGAVADPSARLAAIRARAQETST